MTTAMATDKSDRRARCAGSRLPRQFTAEPLAESLAFWFDQLRLPFNVQFAAFQSGIPGAARSHRVCCRLTSAGSMLSWFASKTWGRSTARLAAAELRRRLDELVASMKSSLAALVSPFWAVVCPPSASMMQVERVGQEYRRLKDSFLLHWPGSAAYGYCVTGTSLPATRRPWKRFLRGSHTDSPYARGFYAGLGTAIVRALHAAEEVSPRKVLVLDCDQTLWSGVSAEDGASDVVVDAPRRAIQEFALKQRAAGVLICLCSKNAEEDVFSVLDRHPDMLLRREHVTAARINWEPKSANLRALAKQLNLGLDSFVFLDDSAVECAEVRARAPEVLTLALPEDTARIRIVPRSHLGLRQGLRRTKETQSAPISTGRRLSATPSGGTRSVSATSSPGLALEINFFAPGQGQSPVFSRS